MAEGTVKLERKRFSVTSESIEAMKRVRDALPGLQAEYPFLSGVSFFGSRTKGTEKPDSDLDLRIFFDPSNSRDLFTIENNTIRFVPNARRAELAKKIAEISGLKLDPHDGSMVEISKEKTDQYIEQFRDYAGQFIANGTVDKNIDDLRITPPVQNLMFQFFLAIGDGVYSSRAYVMNRFRAIPEGEKYFRILMKCLSRVERDSNHKYQTPEYGRLPATIDEAEKYFLTRKDPVEELTSIAA